MEPALRTDGRGVGWSLSSLASASMGCVAEIFAIGARARLEPYCLEPLPTQLLQATSCQRARAHHT